MNPCGDCHACCIAPAIAELGKAPATPCRWLQFEAEQGCAIYHVRPEACRAFSCWWREFEAPAASRPDRIGFLMTTAETESGDLTRVVWETRPGAIDWLMPQLRHMAAAEPIALAYLTGRRTLLRRNGTELELERGHD